MAVTAREVIMVFRGQNYLSGAIRRVSTDVAGLSRLQQAQIQRANIASVQSRMSLQRTAAMQELASVRKGGARYIATQNAIKSAQSNLSQSRITLLGKEETARWRSLAADKQQVKLQTAIADRATLINSRWQARVAYQKAIESGTAEEMAQARKVKDMADEQYRSNIGNQRQLIAHEKELNEHRRVQANIAQQGVSAEKQRMAVQRTALTQAQAREKELVQTEALKAQRVMEVNRGLALQNIKLAQATAMIDTIHWQNFRNLSQWIEHASHVVQMFSLITSATFGFLAKSAADFNTQIVMASTQSTVAGKNTVAQVMANSKVIGDAIKNMMLSGTTIAKPNELSESIYNIFSGVTLPGKTQNQQLKEGIQLLKQFNDVMKANAGMVTMNEVTQAGITLLNVFKVSVDKVPISLNRMQAAVRFMKGNMSDFISTMNQGAPAAKQAGYSFDQFAGSMAAASRWFPSIRFASTGYSRLIDILLRNADSFEKSGIKITTAKGQLLDLSVIAANIIKKYPQLTTGGAIFGRFLKDVTNTQGTMQARRFLTMLIQNLDQYRTVTRQVTGDNNELVKSLKSAERSTGVTWSEFVNQIRAVILIIGEQAIPAFRKMGQPIVNLIHWFQRLSPEWKHIIGYWGSMISLGALVVSTFLSIAGGAGVIIASVVIWWKFHQAMSAAWKMSKALIASNEALIASNRGLAVSEGEVAVAQKAVFASGTLITAGILIFLPLLVIYHKQVGDIIGSLGGWSQALILLAGALVAIKIGSFITALASASGAMKLLMGAGGILTLIALFSNFAHSADGLRHILDALFSGWAGYVATTIAMTAAVRALIKVMAEMQVLAKVTALWTGLSAAVGGAITSFKVARNLRAGLTTGGLLAMSTTGKMGVPERDASGRLTGYLRTGSGQFGRMAPAMGEAAVATSSMGMAVRGLGGALAGLLPMLAIGGVVTGGLYLWKRHLDAVHAAQERVRREQEYMNKVLSADPTIKLMRTYGLNVENVTKAQLDLNDAQRQYGQDVKSGANTQTLMRDVLAIADAQRALANALTISQSGLNAWNQALGRAAKQSNLLQRYQADISRLKEWMNTFKQLNVQQQHMLMSGMPVGDKRFQWLTQLFNLRDINSANNRLKMYENLLNSGQKVLDKTRRQYLYATQSLLRDFERTKTIPKLGTGALQVASQYMMNLKQAPDIPQLKLIARASIALDPASIKNLPAQYAQIMSEIYGQIRMRKPLTKAQIKVLISVLLGIDPNSKIGKQLQTIMVAIVKAIEKSGGLNVGWMNKSQNQINKILNNAVAANAKANIAQMTSTQNRTKYQYATEWKMWNQIQEIVRLHQRAIATGSYKDLVAYYAKLEKVQGQYQGASLQAFNSMLDAQETALNNSVTKQKATYENVLSGLQNMYQNFYSQEQNAFGQIGQGPWMTSGAMQTWQQWGGTPTAKDYQKDINEQISQYQRRNRMMNTLMRKGAPGELLKQIQSLPADQANKELKALTSMAPGQLKRYFGAINRSQKLIHDQTMRDLNNQLDQYKKYGKGIAAAIVAGLTSENQAMEKAIKRLIMKVFPGLPHEATGGGGPPPPKKLPKPPSSITTGPKLPPGVTTGPNLPTLPTNLPTYGDWVKQASKILEGTATVFPKMFVLPGKNPGLLIKGNINLLTRKVAHLANGAIATVESFSIATDKGEVLLSKVLNGKVVSYKTAIQNFIKTGENLGTFASVEAANKYANRLHQQQENFYSTTTTDVKKLTKNASKVTETASRAISTSNGEALKSRVASVHASSSMAQSVRDVATEAIRDMKKITDHIVNPPGSKKPGVSTTSPTTVNHNTTYHVGGVSDNASIETKLRHADFQRRNKYRVNI